MSQRRITWSEVGDVLHRWAAVFLFGIAFFRFAFEVAIWPNLLLLSDYRFWPKPVVRAVLDSRPGPGPKQSLTAIGKPSFYC